MPFKAPRTSPRARQTIRTAFEDLDRTITPVDSRAFADTTLQHVRQAALDIEKQLAARQSLRNMRRLEPLFRGMEHYSKVLDVLCNGTPFLAWVWAPITLILRVSSEYVEAFEHIIAGYSKIAESLVRFELLGDVFGDKMEFQNTIAVFYADILQFHKHAYKFVKRSSWQLMFLTSWGRFQRRFDNILEDMKRHGELVDKEANAHDIAESRQMRQDIRAWREESLEQVEQLEREQAAKQYKTIISWLKADESDQLAIFDAIAAEGAKFPGTCSWIVNNPKIRSWLERKSDHPMLWLQGNLGTGKSVLSTQIVTFMKAAKMFVLHHFCIHSYASSTMYEQILRSLILQILRQDGELVAHVYEDCVLGKKPPAVPALEKLLKTLLPNASHDPRQTEYIWIVLDGLDECDAQKQASVVSVMNQLTAKSSSLQGILCKVLISSGKSSVIANRFRGKQILSLTEEKHHLDKAIRLYASQRFQTMHDKLYQLEVQREEIQEIEVEITKKADGMFLYARLVLDYLAKNIFYSGEEMRNSIHELPDKLFDFYRKILTQILIQLDSRSIDRVRCVFGWIAFTKRPLKRMELLSAIAFSTGDPKISHIAPQFILDICGALLEERRDTTLSFIHSSVRDFLQSPSSQVKVIESEISAEHGKASIACLLSGLDAFTVSHADERTYCRVVKGLYGLIVYATEYWTDYLLSHAIATVAADYQSDALLLAIDLAQKLDSLVTSTADGELRIDQSSFDARLELLDQYPVLQRQMKIAHKGRSLKNLESELVRESATMTSSNSTPAPDGISAMLFHYQEIVRFLLRQDSCPGVANEELEVFKSQFRTSAYTCRLSSCPHTTVGFESEELLREHENSHARRIPCMFSDCKYPPFVSPQALKNHVKTHHNPNPVPKSIRRVGHIRTRSNKTRSPAINKQLGSFGASLNAADIDWIYLAGAIEVVLDVAKGKDSTCDQHIDKESSRIEHLTPTTDMSEYNEEERMDPERILHGMVRRESQQIQKKILAILTQQSLPLISWPAAVSLEERMRVIFTMFENIRLACRYEPIPPSPEDMINFSMICEREMFNRSLDQKQYRDQVADQLSRLVEKDSQNLVQMSMQQRVQGDDLPIQQRTQSKSPIQIMGYRSLSQPDNMLDSTAFPEITPESRPTPTSLKWTPSNRKLDFYKFIIVQGKEPYFQLQAKYSISRDFPPRVFLDSPKIYGANEHLCQYPWGCSSRSISIFKCLEDLKHHYQHAHKAEVETASQIISRSETDLTLTIPELEARVGTTERAEQTHNRLDPNTVRVLLAGSPKSHILLLIELLPKLMNLSETATSTEMSECLTMIQVYSSGERDIERERIQRERPFNASLFNASLFNARVFSPSVFNASASEQGLPLECGTCRVHSGWVDNGLGQWVPCPNCGTSPATP